MDESKEERKKRLAREATARWREKNRPAHRRYQNEYRKKILYPPCSNCGNKVGRRDAKICIKCFAGENHPSWKGGRYKTPLGYVYVKARDNEAGQTQMGYILEHRRVIQDFLGRPLQKHENVHHINGIRDDNRLENLELWISSQPVGQRAHELVAWAKEILQQYGNDFG